MTECICKGNWRNIINEVESLLDRKYINSKGQEYTFFGVVHGSDDYYYGMSSTNSTPTLLLLSCVSDLEGHGFELTYKETSTQEPHWTDRHIVDTGVEFIAYDEAGLEYGRFDTKLKAQKALIAYEGAMSEPR